MVKEANYMNYITLSNGVKMPQLGYGVYLIDEDKCEECTLNAISKGYRSIDTAQMYKNEEGVGQAIVKCAVPRDQLFITTKVWITNAGEKKAEESINESLKKLKSDYIDLILIHQPFGDYYGTWRALEKAYKEGKARAIGVSNFYADRLTDLCINNEILPMVNQMETHVFWQQKEIMPSMKEYGVALESWGPLAQGKNGVFTNPVLLKCAQNHNKTTAQIALRFLLDKGIIVIPKTLSKERMAENIDVFDFTLTPEEIAEIEKLDLGHTQAASDHRSPDKVKMLCAMKP